MEEWEFLNMMIEIGQLITGGKESSLAQMKVRLKMQRRWQVYFWNVVFFKPERAEFRLFNTNYIVQ